MTSATSGAKDTEYLDALRECVIDAGYEVTDPPHHSKYLADGIFVSKKVPGCYFEGAYGFLILEDRICRVYLYAPYNKHMWFYGETYGFKDIYELLSLLKRMSKKAYHL